MKNLDKDTEFEMINFDFPIVDQSENIIKVIGVGGGGGNAVSKMYQNKVHNVSFAICNTDSQALNRTGAPVKVQLGPGLGAGGNPEIGKQYALDALDSIETLFDDQTQMVFITAGLGGGTGTGAGPVIAKMARDKGLLTIGVVTLPFRFEQKRQIEKALKGMIEMKKNVDALLVVNNERLRDIYGNLSLENAFEKTDEVLMTATKSIAEVITRKGVINRDFCDVCTVMRQGGAAIMSEGRANGEKRVEKAILSALNSPLINNVDIKKAKKLLYIIYQSPNEEHKLLTSELDEVTDFMNELQNEVEVLWGLYEDETLEDEVKVNIIATGFDDPEEVIPLTNEQDKTIAEMIETYYGTAKKKAKPAVEKTPAEEASEVDSSAVGTSTAESAGGDDELTSSDGDEVGNDGEVLALDGDDDNGNNDRDVENGVGDGVAENGEEDGEDGGSDERGKLGRRINHAWGKFMKNLQDIILSED